MHVMALDVGEKRIGVALSDPLGSFAIPLLTLDNPASFIEDIMRLVKEYGVERIVAGLPISMDDSLGSQAQKVLAFVEGLTKVSPVPVETWDERLSTVAADHAMFESGTKRDKRKQHRDALAASFILQSYLDDQRSRSARQAQE